MRFVTKNNAEFRTPSHERGEPSCKTKRTCISTFVTFWRGERTHLHRKFATQQIRDKRHVRRVNDVPRARCHRRERFPTSRIRQSAAASNQIVHELRPTFANAVERVRRIEGIEEFVPRCRQRRRLQRRQSSTTVADVVRHGGYRRGGKMHSRRPVSTTEHERMIEGVA